MGDKGSSSAIFGGWPRFFKPGEAISSRAQSAGMPKRPLRSNQSPKSKDLGHPATADDGCCPAGANALTDNDCLPVAGNGICEPGEDSSSTPQDCVLVIPTITEWGVLILALMLMVSAKIKWTSHPGHDNRLGLAK